MNMGYGYTNGYGNGYTNGCGFGFGGGSVMMFLFIILIGVVIYFVVKNNNLGNQSQQVSQPTVNNKSSEAIEIAKTRLAKGEITAEEFENIKKNL